MTGEDLCTVGVVPVQSDLCLRSAIWDCLLQTTSEPRQARSRTPASW
jgi:hypothetical protein